MDRIHGFQGLDLYVTTLLTTSGNMMNLGTLFDEWLVALNLISYPIDSVSRDFDWVHIRSYDYHSPLTDNFTAEHTPLYDPSSRYQGNGAKAKGMAITRDGLLSYEYIKRYLRGYRVKSVYNSTYLLMRKRRGFLELSKAAGTTHKTLFLNDLHGQLHAYVLWKEGNGMEFIDPSLNDASSTYKLIKCMQVALLCVEEKWAHRP
ncbi:hypothetical protein OSB04_015166 [Centaurea solstitialis]|uniref:Uncharacterized protein n=1 Tax=Centaurea solstitialis TaxID=347529 RepID=A0AA38WJV5_9ASTR|nr:hypothetical protein OSB04_015166 [Centaurea solstitialis]